MTAFIQGIFTFPTLFYSGLLVLVMLYWVTTIIGVSEIDMLDGDVDLDVDSSASGFASWLSKFKLEGIPITITLSFIILVAWALCFIAVYFIYPLLPVNWVQIAIGFWIFLIAPVIAAIIVSPLLQPLKPLFKNQAANSVHDFVGQYATVRSGKVTATFGEAECRDGGAGLIIKIRADEPNTHRRGDQVRLHSYDPATNTYQVSS